MLPGADLAVVEEEKLRSYLLSEIHPAGRAKAAFFRAFGFRARSWRRLRDALLEHGHTSSIVAAAETEFGRKYILEGPLMAPDGRRPTIRAVWFVASGEAVPRLVTAYPALGARR
jgi:hypothetical protein